MNNDIYNIHLYQAPEKYTCSLWKMAAESEYIQFRAVYIQFGQPKSVIALYGR